MKILLMEDDAVLSDILLDYLRESWSVDYAFNSEEVYKKLESNRYDLFIFDINVAGKNGLELLKELRKFNNTTPTIIITAYTDTSYLKKAFSLGAHDYIKKPFELEELNVRIQNTKKLFNIDNKNNIPITDDILFSIQTKTITKNSKEYAISQKDSDILVYFINNQKRVITNEELTQNIWDFDSIPSDATIRSHIRTLREIIGKDKIQTVRGVGYQYE
ncbi:MAG: response regulator transcription factor [Sulfurimonas sp.]|uniref:response regulator transcription factor n=1 Tax=Sulfurimonas sp. TaxID=2022749 RepID=UPI0026219BC6|nr:response regulator transcription factor [Sulfurimonas sp.]MCW8894615.1 response regulator transcription factor [Sulfurimonas sp.]MCW8955058.1 response regulator transcription factor [Sulfurimonas sp.]MCW9067435.1 response regulator transcription factor [Sulfurimonas sp.]